MPNVQLDVVRRDTSLRTSIAMDPNSPEVVVAGSILDNVYRLTTVARRGPRTNSLRHLGCLATHV